MKRIIKRTMACSLIALSISSCKKEIANVTNNNTAVNTIAKINTNEVLHETITLPITLKDGTTTTISVQSYYTPGASLVGDTKHGAIGVLIPGMAHKAAFYDPLIHNIMTSSKGYTNMLKIDLPGQGTSPIPAGKRFGEISIEDYTDFYISVLEALKKKNINVISITGHSLGALIIQHVQDKLKKRGSGLDNMFSDPKKDQHVKIYLLSSAIPGNTPWGAADLSVDTVGSPKSIILYVFSITPVDVKKGPYLAVPDDLFVGFFYTNKAGASAPGFLAALANKTDHPFVSAAQLIGLDPVTLKDAPRIKLEGTDIFGKAGDTKEELHVIIGSEDRLITPAEQQAMTDNLKPGTKVDVITDTYAVHGLPFTDPAKIAAFY